MYAIWAAEYLHLSQIAVLLLAALVIYVCARRIYLSLVTPLRHIPGPWYAPYTALHLRYFFSTGDIWKYAEKMHKKYGPIIRLGPRQIWVADPAAVKQILLTIDLPKVTMYSEISRDKTAPGLFGEIRPEPHRRLKKFLSPAFTMEYVKGLDHLFQQSMGTLIDKYEVDAARVPPTMGSTQFETDLMEDLHNVALDIMGECSFGKGFGQTNPYAEAPEGAAEAFWRSIPRSIFDTLAKRYQTVYIKLFLRALGLNCKFDWSPHMIQAIDSTIQKRKLDPTSHARPDLLQHILTSGTRPDTGIPFTPREIIDQASEILLAGSETTSSTLCALFIHLARTPHVQSKLLSTLPPLFPSDPIISPQTVKHDPRFEYLNACIKECLRLSPIASELGRKTGKSSVVLMGYEVPANTVVSASYRAVHLDAGGWEEPGRFWPERWMGEEGRREGAPAPNMNAYFPFSAGRHSCIGINFAWAEMRVVAANILSRYDVEEVPGQNLDWRQYVTIQLSDGHWRVMLKPRWKNFDD